MAYINYTLDGKNKKDMIQIELFGEKHTFNFDNNKDIINNKLVNFCERNDYPIDSQLFKKLNRLACNSIDIMMINTLSIDLNNYEQLYYPAILYHDIVKESDILLSTNHLSQKFGNLSKKQIIVKIATELNSKNIETLKYLLIDLENKINLFMNLDGAKSLVDKTKQLIQIIELKVSD